MENITSNPKPASVTLADLCIAIASGKLNVTISAGYYLFAQRELAQVLGIATTVKPQPALPLCTVVPGTDQ